MPVSWEVATAYKMAGQGSTCVAVEGPQNSNILNFRVQDPMSFGFCMNGEPSIGPPNCRLTSANNENVMRGLSALSLHASSENIRNGLHNTLFCELPEMETATVSSSNEDLPLAFVPASVCCGHFDQTRSLCNGDLLQHGDLSNEAINNDSCGSLHFDGLHRTDPGPSFCGKMEESIPRMDCQLLVQNSHSIVSDSSTEGMLRTDGFDLETISESSSLSNNCMLSASSSEEASQLCDESEVQSSYDEGNVLRAEESPNPARRGLSGFYAGKSRSFSCLRDAVSAKDLAKPESPHLKKRKINASNASGSRLPPLQKGSATICKKPSQNGKSTLALAVAMSATQENEPHPPSANLKSFFPSRSYSLSDLQGAARKGSLFLIG